MYDKGISRNYEDVEMLEKFNGWNIELNQEILKVAEGHEVNLRKVLGKAISNILEMGRETQEILNYAVDCFSLGRVNSYADLQLFGMEEPVYCWCKAYMVELGGELWQLKFAVPESGSSSSRMGYSKLKLKRRDVQFGEGDGEVVDWTTSSNEQFIPIEQLRGI